MPRGKPLHRAWPECRCRRRPRRYVECLGVECGELTARPLPARERDLSPQPHSATHLVRAKPIPSGSDELLPTITKYVFARRIGQLTCETCRDKSQLPVICPPLSWHLCGNFRLHSRIGLRNRGFISSWISRRMASLE